MLFSAGVMLPAIGAMLSAKGAMPPAVDVLAFAEGAMPPVAGSMLYRNECYALHKSFYAFRRRYNAVKKGAYFSSCQCLFNKLRQLKKITCSS
jgi:hypothetical protein